jgi:hypothetical protein
VDYAEQLARVRRLRDNVTLSSQDEAAIRAVLAELDRLLLVQQTHRTICDAIEPWQREQANAGRTGILASQAVPMILAERDRLAAQLADARRGLEAVRDFRWHVGLGVGEMTSVQRLAAETLAKLEQPKGANDVR